MAEAAHAAEQTVQDYIIHHLSYLTFGKNPDTGSWEFATTMEAATDMGFMAFHVDTMFWSFFLGGGALLFFRYIGKKATSDTPSGIQNFVQKRPYCAACTDSVCVDSVNEFNGLGAGGLAPRSSNVFRPLCGPRPHVV
jgi:F0F1-type ATP synthase membrane subunit a